MSCSKVLWFVELLRTQYLWLSDNFDVVVANNPPPTLGLINNNFVTNK